MAFIFGDAKIAFSPDLPNEYSVNVYFLSTKGKFIPVNVMFF